MCLYLVFFFFLEFKEASKKGGYTLVAPACRRRSSRLPRLRTFQDPSHKTKDRSPKDGMKTKRTNEGGEAEGTMSPIDTFGLQALPTPAQSKAVFPLLPAFGMGSVLTLLVEL